MCQVRTVYTSEQKVQNLPSKYTSITTLQTVPLKASSVLHAGGNAGQADQASGADCVTCASLLGS